MCIHRSCICVKVRGQPAGLSFPCLLWALGLELWLSGVAAGPLPTEPPCQAPSHSSESVWHSVYLQCRQHNIYESHFVQSGFLCPCTLGGQGRPSPSNSYKQPKIMSLWKIHSFPSANKIIYEAVWFSNREQKGKKLLLRKQQLLSWWDPSFPVWNIHIRDLVF